ncbi:helix-turn-helix domain-containing protein [Pseudomarimonas arenosa]|uniref:Helix-turn-helix domain-containing protein n=1 Tax=Pseudomarimonas arenosa TaxID=2774145 RepID=A0AAW3ZDY7_9GAMM|nr:helix-turn-helix domain-containing protein [Pseudomarimonas arenosa]MBD8524388.1 helix-turn-helix domain-containing protein [Pseudomarimonas arenosa]
MTGQDQGSAWVGRVALGPGWAVFTGCAGDNRPHRHPALQLALSVEGPVRADVDGRLVEGAGLLIGPDVTHRLHPGPVRLLYVERQSAAGLRLGALCRHGLVVFDAATASRLCALWQTHNDAASIDPLIAALAGGSIDTQVEQSSAQPTSSRRRIRAVIADLPQRPAAEWTLARLSAATALSPSRFAHAFREQTGMALRPYLRWLRLALALGAVSRGASLTDAAHAAGFADAAHFTRTMRRHFGVTPGSLLVPLRSRHPDPSLEAGTTRP